MRVHPLRLARPLARSACGRRPCPADRGNRAPRSRRRPRPRRRRTPCSRDRGFRRQKRQAAARSARRRSGGRESSRPWLAHVRPSLCRAQWLFRRLRTKMTIEIPDAEDTEALALASRNGWPEDMRHLIARYPREQWDSHANLGSMARFWLSRHAMFWELAGMLTAITGDFREGRIAPSEFPQLFVPR